MIRVKKGLYVFGPDYHREPYSLEIMANKIYGPSYISREYALAYYGIIPEYVVEVTSVTPKRSRHFDTPIGRFSYLHVPSQFYQVGFNLIKINDKATALMASPEKALADLLYLRNVNIMTTNELLELLFDDLRLEEGTVSQMQIGIFAEVLKIKEVPVLKFLIEWLKTVQK